MIDTTGLTKTKDKTFIIASVKDELAGTFMAPSFFPTEDLAIRQFRSSINNIPLWKDNPSDFSLYHLGTYSETTGMIYGTQPTKIIGGTGLVDRNNNI